MRLVLWSALPSRDAQTVCKAAVREDAALKSHVLTVYTVDPLLSPPFPNTSRLLRATLGLLERCSSAGLTELQKASQFWKALQLEKASQLQKASRFWRLPGSSVICDSHVAEHSPNVPFSTEIISVQASKEAAAFGPRVPPKSSERSLMW